MTARNKNIPALRFKGFEGEWESKSGTDIFISSRKKGNTALPIYSVTLDRGMVPRNSLDRTMLSDAKATDSLFVAKNDIAYNMMRMWQGAYGLSPENCMVSPAYVVLHPKANISSDFFIEHFARSRSLYLFTAYSYGLTSDRLRLYFKDFALIKFNLPKLPEQQKIASFLSSIDEKIRQLTRRKELLEQYKKGAMQQLFSGKRRFKDEKGKVYPKWEEKKLGEIADIKRGGSPRPITDPKWFDSNSKIGWVRISDVTKSNKYLNETVQYLSKEGIAKSRLVKKGSMIMSICATIGKPIYTKFEVCIHDGFVVFENLRANKEYLYYYLDKIQLGWYKYGQPGTQVNLNIEIVSNETIPYPSLDEQQKIATFLSSIDTKIESVTAQIERTQRYKKGLLQQMFV